MMMRKHALPEDNRKRFSPEAYGDFPIVDVERIAELRARMARETASEEWEVLEGVLEH